MRKKRTYVKRSDEEMLGAGRSRGRTAAVVEPVAEPIVEVIPEPVVVEEVVAPEPEPVVEPEPIPEPTFVRGSGTDNIEEQRIAAIANRRKAAEAAKVAAEQLLNSKLMKLPVKPPKLLLQLKSEEAKKAGKAHQTNYAYRH